MSASTSTGSLRQRGASLVQRVLPEGVARRVAQNTGWLLGERVFRLVAAFAVTIWLVRYLGPADFGVLAYAISISMIAEVTAGLGVAQIVVRQLVEAPEDESHLLGSALVLRFVAGLAIVAGTLALTWWSDGDARSMAVVAIIVGVVPFRALSTFDQAFQARMQSRLSVVARTSGFLISALAKVVLLVAGAPLVAFAVAVALEVVVSAIAFTVLYARSGGRPFGLDVQWWRARALLRESWPLAIAAGAAMISLRIDQVMLKQMTGDADVGAYAAAARLSEVWYFVPVALGTALFPVLVGARGDRAAQDQRLQTALDLSAWLAIVIAFAVTVLGGLVIHVLYGPRFEDSAGILRMQVWAGPFVFMGVITGRALLAEGLQRFESVRYVLGALVNIGLNLVLIPRYGGMGAAFATLISYILVTYVMVLAYPRTRHLGWLMTRSLLLPFRLRSEYLRREGARPAEAP